MASSESPFSQLSDELWHVFGGRRRFPTTREWHRQLWCFQTRAIVCNGKSAPPPPQKKKVYGRISFPPGGFNNR